MGLAAQSAQSAQSSQLRDIDSTISDLRRKMRAIEGGGSSGSAPAAAVIAEPAVRAPRWLAPHLPGKGFPAAAATQVDYCPSMIVDVVAALTASGGCAAVVNFPELALAAVAAAGGDMERIVLIPDASPHTSAVLATLVEGMDMVVFHGRRETPASGALPASFTRSVDARLHKSRCALLISGATWPSARLHVTATVAAVTGLGRGAGRIKGVELDVTTWGKAHPPQRFTALVGAEPVALAESAEPATVEQRWVREAAQ